MELKTFAKLIASDSTNIAKNTLSYLIGNGQKNDAWNEALAELYKSFPNEVKNDIEAKKEFLPIIIKYFTTYKINDNNFSIYKEYEDLISAKNKDVIKSISQDWDWESEDKIVFKNSLAFSIALANQKSINYYLFLEKYEDQFYDFSKISKDKILKHFNNHNIWEKLIKEDYIKFIKLCNDNDYDRIEIIKTVLIPFGLSFLNNLVKTEQMNSFLIDLNTIGKDNLKEINNFYPKNKNEGLKGNSVFKILVEIINEKKYISAMSWFNFFEKEIQDYALLYNVSSIKKSESFKKLIDVQLKEYKHYLTTPFNKDLIQIVSQNEEWLNFLNKYDVLMSLEKEVNKKDNKISKIKI